MTQATPTPSPGYSLTVRAKILNMPGSLGPEYIVPSVFDRRVTDAVAHAVNAAAHRTGVSRRREN
jgi:malic enzyme